MSQKIKAKDVSFGEENISKFTVFCTEVHPILKFIEYHFLAWR